MSLKKKFFLLLIIFSVFFLLKHTEFVSEKYIDILALFLLSIIILKIQPLIHLRFLFIELFFRTITINAYMFTRFGMLTHFNLGDDLNWFLIKKIQPFQVSLLNKSILSRLPFYKKENFLIIGSTISFLTNERTVIWGAGAMDDKSPLCAKPKKVCAVRGPLTRNYLLKNGVNCPPIYGDPALLTKFFYRPRIGKKYKLGIIPHYVDYYSEKFKELKKDPEILFIKMHHYKNIATVLDQIVSCEKIISSSLHGLILSETYDVPNIWIKVSNNISGGNFKYMDYYESIGIYNAKPYLFTGKESLKELIHLFNNYKKGHIDLNPLIKAAPFELNLKKENLEV